MGTLSIRTDAAMEHALQVLAAEHGSRTAAVRYALLRATRDVAGAEPETDRDEIVAIMRYMGTA